MKAYYLNIVSELKFDRCLEYLIRYFQSKECGPFGPQLVIASRVF